MINYVHPVTGHILLVANGNSREDSSRKKVEDTLIGSTVALDESSLQV